MTGLESIPNLFLSVGIDFVVAIEGIEVIVALVRANLVLKVFDDFGSDTTPGDTLVSRMKGRLSNMMIIEGSR